MGSPTNNPFTAREQSLIVSAIPRITILPFPQPAYPGHGSFAPYQPQQTPQHQGSFSSFAQPAYPAHGSSAPDPPQQTRLTPDVSSDSERSVRTQALSITSTPHAAKNSDQHISRRRAKRRQRNNLDSVSHVSDSAGEASETSKGSTGRGTPQTRKHLILPRSKKVRSRAGDRAWKARESELVNLATEIFEYQQHSALADSLYHKHGPDGCESKILQLRSLEDIGRKVTEMAL